MIIDCAHYKDGVRRDEGAVALEEAAARTTQGGFVWLGLFEPGPEELAQVSETFGLHELAVEDAQNIHLRPKIENYDNDVRLSLLNERYMDIDAGDPTLTKWTAATPPTARQCAELVSTQGVKSVQVVPKDVVCVKTGEGRPAALVVQNIAPSFGQGFNATATVWALSG